MYIEMRGTCEQLKLKVPRVLRYWPPESRSCSMRSERLWSTQDRRPHLQSLSMPFNRARCCKNHVLLTQFARFQIAKLNKILHRQRDIERVCAWINRLVVCCVVLQLDRGRGMRAGLNYILRWWISSFQLRAGRSGMCVVARTWMLVVIVIWLRNDA